MADCSSVTIGSAVFYVLKNSSLVQQPASETDVRVNVQVIYTN